MTAPASTRHSSTRRLLPLYIAAFLQSCVFWYSIEKLFMTSIGFTATTIGLMAAAYSVVMLLLETPSGLLADRWSRKGILIVASLLLAASAIICGLSTGPVMYIVGAMFWGGFYALYSGTYDPIVYDTLLEDSGDTQEFKHYYGWVKFCDGLGLVVGALAGGLIASALNLQSAFFWSVPLALLAIAALAVFREPRLHQAHAATPVIEHVRHTFQAVLSHTSLFGLLLVLVIGTVLSELIFEFSQFWLIATATPVGQYGPASAILLSTVGIAGLLAAKIRLNSRTFVVIFTTILLISSSTLILSHSTWAIVAAQTTLSIGLLALGVIYLEKLHDQLPSRVRAGAASAISTLSRAVFVIYAILFGWVTQNYNVFSASWMIFIPLAIVCWFIYNESLRKPTIPPAAT